MRNFITEMCCYTGNWNCVSDMLKKNEKQDNSVAVENGMYTKNFSKVLKLLTSLTAIRYLLCYYLTFQNLKMLNNLHP